MNIDRILSAEVGVAEHCCEERTHVASGVLSDRDADHLHL
jgi:hypothetical protein